MSYGDHSQADREHRANVLGMGLTAMVVMFLVVVLIFLTGGYFLYCVLILAGIVLLSTFHYALWGRAMSEEVAPQREEERLRQKATSEEWSLPSGNDGRGIRKPSR
jgi:hypothetical protein